MELSILIISYNTRELTLACLASVFLQTKGAFEVIVVDNASADGSADAIAERFPQVRLIRGEKNLGFARANNLGAREAAGEWLLLLNPDTVVLDGAIDKLVAFAKTHREASIFGGRTLFADGSLNPASCWRRPTPWSVFCIASGLTSLFPKSWLFARESYGAWKRDSVRKVDIVSGCFFLIRRRVWDELGGFDLAFFMYGEEVDLCLRAKSLGHRCLICPDAVIIHHGGASEKARADKMLRLFAAKARLFRKHWRPAIVSWGVEMLSLWALIRIFALGVLRCLRPRYRESYQVWREVWRRRDEFRCESDPRNSPDSSAPTLTGHGSTIGER